MELSRRDIENARRIFERGARSREAEKHQVTK
jgi:hypothetical protein